MSYSAWILCLFVSTGVRGEWSDGDPGRTLEHRHVLGAAAALGDERVLIAGGLQGLNPFATRRAELYDPLARKWSRTDSLTSARWSVDAVTLNDGTVLIAGGSTGLIGVVLDSAETFDPLTESFTLTSNTLSVARHAYGISMLNDGRAVLTGGNTSSTDLGGTGVDAVDVYDPSTRTFSTLAPLHSGRSLHAQVSLRDGRLVVIGGARDDAEVYDPTGNAWTVSTNTMPTTLKDMKAFELFDGRVFIAAGQNTATGETTDATWFFDPDTGLFSPGPSMAGFNYSPPGKTIQVGTSDYSAWDLFIDKPGLFGRFILIAGGEHDPLVGDDVELYSASIYCAASNSFIDVGPMPFVHDDHTEAMLPLGVSSPPEFILPGGNTSSGTSRFVFKASDNPQLFELR